MSNKITPIKLTTVNDHKVHSGDVIMLKCDGNTNSSSSLLPKAYRDDCYLNCYDGLAGGITTLSPSNTSAFIIKRFRFFIFFFYLRNLLFFYSVDGSPEGAPIKFGQPFIITTIDGQVIHFLILIFLSILNIL